MCISQRHNNAIKFAPLGRRTSLPLGRLWQPLGLMKILRYLFLACVLLSTFAMADPPAVKIGVLADGSLLLNGEHANLEQIEKAFISLQKERGMVWYYRDPSLSEPPKQAFAVLDLVGKYSLPITLSSKPDYSVYIGSDGKSHPRKP